ncbi:MAG TPA: zinc-dependent metalloprotease [Acidimicrobiales bacterium]|nr:zinc-dependent metalloprotease [Acidimicrobiales bacterium]
MSSPVSWETAERVATWVGAGRPVGPVQGAKPLDAVTWSSLREDFAEATARAEELVVEATGLRPTTGAAQARVVDRPEWIRANLASFRRLLEPALTQLEGAVPPGPLAGAARSATGAQLGLVLGWMSTRVLGQYDLLFAESADDDTGGMVSYVGPNIVALERRYAFPPRQFRMWIALHEVTHRCQFTGVPWLKDYFLGLVEEGLAGMPTDPRRLAEALRRAGHAVRLGRNPLEDAGMLGLVAPPEQLEVIGRIQALMSLLEGHGDVTMDRVGGDDVPDAAWFSRVLRERRKSMGPVAKLLVQLVGIEAKLRQYEQGERFIAAVEAAGGPDVLARVWEGAANLPSMDEIRRPELWVERMGTPSIAAG